MQSQFKNQKFMNKMLNEKVKACRETVVSTDQVMKDLQEENKLLQQTQFEQIDTMAVVCENKNLNEEMIKLRKELPVVDEEDLNKDLEDNSPYRSYNRIVTSIQDIVYKLEHQIEVSIEDRTDIRKELEDLSTN